MVKPAQRLDQTQPEVADACVGKHAVQVQADASNMFLGALDGSPNVAPSGRPKARYAFALYPRWVDQYGGDPTLAEPQKMCTAPTIGRPKIGPE